MAEPKTKEQQEEEDLMAGFIAEYQPQIKFHIGQLKRRFLIPHDEEEKDLYLHGQHGLMDAIVKHNPKIAKFKTYAEDRIKGKILDHVHGKHGISKGIKEQAGFVKKNQQRAEAAAAEAAKTAPTSPVQLKPNTTE